MGKIDRIDWKIRFDWLEQLLEVINMSTLA